MRIRTLLACPILLAALASGCTDAPANPAPAPGAPVGPTPPGSKDTPKKPGAVAKKHKATPGGAAAPSPTNIPDI